MMSTPYVRLLHADCCLCCFMLRQMSKGAIFIASVPCCLLLAQHAREEELRREGMKILLAKINGVSPAIHAVFGWLSMSM